MDTDEILKVILEDIKDIKEKVIELVKQGAEHNVVLKEHEKRSTMLEEQMKPIRTHVDRVQGFLYIVLAVSIAVVSQWLIKLFL